MTLIRSLTRSDQSGTVLDAGEPAFHRLGRRRDMNTPRPLVTSTRELVLLLAAAAAASSAAASVTPVEAGAVTQTQVGVGQPDTVRSGPSDLTFDIAADPYVVSRLGDKDERGLSEAEGVARSAVQFTSPDKADFFVSSSAKAGPSSALVGSPYASHGAASGSAFYDFSVDAASTLSLSFSAFSSATPDGNAYIALNLFDYDTHRYLRQGVVDGIQTEHYIVPVGSYGLTLTAFSEGYSPALTPVSEAAGNAIANLSLSVSAQAVPEPASWMLILLGVVAATVPRRKRRLSR